MELNTLESGKMIKSMAMELCNQTLLSISDSLGKESNGSMEDKLNKIKFIKGVS